MAASSFMGTKPHFVMEFVDGCSITEYCNRNRSRQYLAQSLSELGRYGEAQALYLGTIDNIENGSSPGISEAWCDFARVAALAGHPEDALTYLRNAAHAGYNDAGSVSSDVDFTSLRKDPRMAQVVAVMQREVDPASQTRN